MTAVWSDMSESTAHVHTAAVILLRTHTANVSASTAKNDTISHVSSSWNKELIPKMPQIWDKDPQHFP